MISKLRVKLKITPYVHEKKPDIEKCSNQSKWLENTLVEAEKQRDTSQNLQTPAQEDMNIKRNKEEGSYTTETTTETKFKFRYSKKSKLNPTNKEVETIEVIDTEIAAKDNAPSTIIEEEQRPTTSNTQLIQK